MNNNERIVFLDWLRVIACLMVICIHCIEPFYLGGKGTQILTLHDAMWCTLLDSPLRAAVPLFVMASSFLLVPLRYDTGTFFRKRFVRVFVPFLIWSIAYTLFVPIEGQSIADNFRHLIFNFHAPAGHLWFIYMLIGIYMLMPIISPWLEKIGRKEERAFLWVWAFSTCLPYIRRAAIYLTGTSELYGEACWNAFGTFHYVSGFMGYVILAHYLRKWVTPKSWAHTLSLAIPTWGVGYAINAIGYWIQIPSEYPINATNDLAINMETTWTFCSLGTLLTTFALFIVIRKITCAGALYHHIVRPISEASYGTYLMHMFILTPTHAVIRPIMEQSVCNLWATPLCIFGATIATFVIAACLSCVFKRIPVVGKWVIG